VCGAHSWGIKGSVNRNKIHDKGSKEVKNPWKLQEKIQRRGPVSDGNIEWSHRKENVDSFNPGESQLGKPEPIQGQWGGGGGGG